MTAVLAESTWRGVLLSATVALALIRVVSHIRARTWEIANTAGGALLLFQIALTVPALGGFIAYLWNPELMAWSHWGFPAAVRVLGAVLVWISTFFLGWAQLRLGSNFSPLLRVRSGQRLIETGPYRYVRHPMYTAIALLSVGVFLLTANWLIGVTWIACTALVIFIRTPREERMMTETFGDSYRAYMERTPRFVPAFGMAGSRGVPGKTLAVGQNSREDPFR